VLLEAPDGVARVRAITSIRELATFRRLMGLLASRCGRMLNKTDLAAPLGVSVPTLTQWLSILPAYLGKVSATARSGGLIQIALPSGALPP